ncbi:MAG: hypothetical protein CMH50_09225 [Myxococcales bacterium]|nr:hypothetical protein [Myxococcales bacterium]
MSRLGPLAFTLMVAACPQQVPDPAAPDAGAVPAADAGMLTVDAGEQDPRDAGTTTDAGEVSEPLCRPDPERLNGVYHCRLDEHCPCGAHCALGRCIYDCLEGVKACEDDERCTLFGRCVQVSDEAPIEDVSGEDDEQVGEETPMPDPTPVGRVQLERLRYRVHDADTTLALRLTVIEADVSAVRVGGGRGFLKSEESERLLPDEPLLVSCTGTEDEDFIEECTLDTLSAGSEHVVYLRPRDVAGDANRWEISVFHGSVLDTLTVEKVESAPFLPETVPVTGSYEGSVQISDGDGRAMLSVPVRAEVLEDGGELRMKLIDSLRMLSADGVLWGQPTEAGFAFRRDHYLGDEAEALGDVEIHSKLESPQPLAGSGYGWLGGRFHLGIMGWLPVSQYLACYNAQFPCQFGQQHPCCGNTRDSTHLWEQMIEAASVDLKVFRRGPLPEGSEVRDHQNHMEESNSRFGDLRERIWSEDARSPWDQVAQEIFELDEINPVIDSRAQDWATLSDDSMSLMRCETQWVEDHYSCRGANAGNFGQNLPTCTDAVIAAMPERCNRYVVNPCWNGPEPFETRCIHNCYGVILDGDGPEPLTPQQYRTRDMELAQASLCAERFFCYEPPAGDDFAAESSGLFERVLPISGDLTCAQAGDAFRDQIPTAIGLFTNADAEEAEEESLNAGEMLEACFRDLDRDLPDLAGRGPIWDRADLRRVFRTEGCIDLARFWASLRWASAPAMFAAIDPAVRQSEELGDQSKANGLYLRLLTQWLQLHQFLATEGLQAHRLAKVLRQGQDEISPTAVPNLARLRQVLAGAWDVFLRPRFVTGLMGLSPTELRNADYRPIVFPQLNLQARAYHEQGVGLPVFLVEAMTTYMEVLVAEGEEVWIEGRQLQRHQGEIAEAVRQSVLMESLAQRVFERAEVGETRWGPRYLKARTQLKAVRGRVLRVLDNMMGEGNPLGIEDDDLPLYFRVDEAGDVGRFSVISRYFLDQGDGLATRAVETAADALGRARGSWLQLRDAVLQDRNHVNEQNEREIATAQRYGDEILQLCGAHRGWQRPDDPNDDAPVRSDEAIQWLGGLEHHGQCLLDSSQANCRLEAQLLYEALRPGHLEYQMCRGIIYRYRFDDGVGFNNTATNQRLVDSLQEVLDAHEAGTFGDAAIYLENLVSELTEEERRGFFEGMYGTENITLEQVTEIHDGCLSLLPNAPPTLPTYATLADGPLQNHSCYMGAMGEAELEAMQARKNMEAARAAIAEHVEAYNIAVQSCHYGSQAGSVQETLMENHMEVMGKLRAVRLAATIAAEAADVASSWWEEIVCFGCGVVGVAAKTTIQVMSDAMDAATARHELAMTRYQNYYDDLICFNDAKLHLVGMKTAQINLEGAKLGLEQAVLRTRGMMGRLDALLAEGTVATERVRQWDRPPIAHDQWLDEDVDTFLHAMRRAKRTAYLAVRAAEYEFQMSRDERGLVLSASHPGELTEALAQLRSVVNTQRINGRSPENYRAIFSLKTHLLQLASRAEFPETQYRLNDTQRFRALVNSQRYAIYDRDGEYLGQRIPFALTPFDLQDNGEGFSLPVVSASRDCAERLWGVNVSLDGDRVVPEGAARRSARVELLHKNSFFSRWCSDAEGQEAYQVQTVRPERNLFRDPLAGAPQGAQEPQVGRFPGWTRARVDARLNIEPDAFNAEDYRENESTELAARGLYGDYALFFPKEMLKASTADGIDLRRLRDVRLRFDFVSVAR